MKILDRESLGSFFSLVVISSVIAVLVPAPVALAQGCYTITGLSATISNDNCSAIVSAGVIPFQWCGFPTPPHIGVRTFAGAPSDSGGTPIPSLSAYLGCDYFSTVWIIEFPLPDSIAAGTQLYFEVWFLAGEHCSNVPPAVVAVPNRNSSTTFTIEYMTAIPCSLVGSQALLTVSEFEVFRGDHPGSTYRSRHRIRVTIDESGGISWVADVDFGETAGYRPNQVMRSLSRPGPCGWFVVDDNPTRARADKDDPSLISITAEPRNATSFLVRVHLDAPNPLVSIACNIRADYTILIERGCNGAAARFAVRGAHNRYPAHRLAINGMTVHEYTPRSGSGPGSLCRPDSIQVRIPLTFL